jgi:hypothetical protein
MTSAVKRLPSRGDAFDALDGPGSLLGEAARGVLPPNVPRATGSSALGVPDAGRAPSHGYAGSRR